MCTYETKNINLNGKIKLQGKWDDLTKTALYVDHPSGSLSSHCLVLDFYVSDEHGRAVAIELDGVAARQLAASLSDLVAKYSELLAR